MATEAKRVTDIGPPHYEQFLHPLIKENYGKWQYHDSIKPGVLSHTGPEGTIYTVRCASPRLVSVNFLRNIMDLADKYCDGYFRFTSRNNIEFLLEKQDNIDPLIADLERHGHAGRRHQQRHLQRSPHPGLGTLPLGRDRRLRPGQGGHG